MTKFYSMAGKRTKVESRNTQNFYVGLLNKCNKHEDEAAAGLIVYVQGRDVFSPSESVRNAWDGVHQTIEAMEREKGTVGLIESISKILIACRAKGEIVAKDKSCTRMLFCLVVVKESLNEFAV